MSGSAAQIELTTSAQAIYTAPAGTKAQITACDVFEKTGVNKTVTVYIVKSGDSTGTAATAVWTKTVNASDALQITNLIGHVLRPGDAVHMLASANSAVNVRISVAEET